MQKKLIALAVAGLVSSGAFAQSNVTISGLLRMSTEQYKIGNSGAASYSAETRVSDQSSMIVFSGKEDMGGGNFASFNIDNRFSPDLGAFAAGGNTNVGIGGAWGTVKMGRQDLHYGTAIEAYKAYTLQNILSNGIFAQVNGTTVANATRTPNVLMYDTPMMNGFSARLAYSANAAATEGSGLNDGSKNGAWNLDAKYANGPLKARYSYWNSKAEGGAAAALTNQRGDTVDAGYTLPMGLTFGLGWNKSTLSSDQGASSSRTAWIVPVSYTFGANEVAATYAKAGNTATSNTGAKAYTLAYSYMLSKRTNTGVSYTNLKNDSGASYDLFAIGANGGTNTPTGTSVTQFSWNLNHAF